ncbi:MAG: hypothetical protein L0H53_03855 [Candidatus Nitrosocosmicus sp.]|nr:hypothetical protein [Candidatus Nitrosocosmicus sp.]MDN5866239.1 hypothetical protein [Candidatus Nitrosocosmicus sp.]
MSSFKVLGINDAGTPLRFGGDDLDKINNILNGQDLTLDIVIDNEWSFNSNKLVLRDSSGSNKIKIATSAEAADWIITIPTLGGNEEMLFADTVQTLTNKTIDSSLNTVTNIPDSSLSQITDKAKLPNDTLYTNDSQTITQKKIDIQANSFFRLSRYGNYTCTLQRGIDATGLLSGLVGLGNQLDSVSNNRGNYNIWQTLSGSNNDIAGVVKFDAPITKRFKNALFRFVFIFDNNSLSNRRIFKGFGPARLLDASDTVPVASNESCFLFGHGGADTQFFVYHNDASGTCVKDSTSINLPLVATNYILELEANDTSVPKKFTWSLWDMDTTGDKGTLQGTGDITTRIPAQTSDLYYHDIVESVMGTLINNKIYYNEVFTQ